MLKTKISLGFNDQKGKKRKEYANCITRELVSPQKTEFSQAAFYLPDLSHLNPYLFSSPIILLLISLFIMEVNYSRDDDSLHQGLLKITFPRKLM